jgi:PHD/YefM family antitoxin component YafN of YafNO toxin-antitoxin module
MPEKMKSISEARQNLPSLSQTAQKRLDRYIITHKGQPQSVLLSYKDYLGMKAAAELSRQPEIVESIRTGLRQLDAGKGLTPDEAGYLFRVLKLAKESNAEPVPANVHGFAISEE